MTIAVDLNPNTGAIPSIAEENSDHKPQSLLILLRDGQPCNEVIPSPVPRPLPTKEAQKEAQKAATRARLATEDAKAMSHAAAVMSIYGPTGKPAGSYVPPEGTWSSGQPNEYLSMACAVNVYGATRTEWEPRSIANPIRADRARKARALEGVEATGIESMQAITDRWQFLPGKGCLSSSSENQRRTCYLSETGDEVWTKVNDLIWIEESTETGHWEHVAAQPALAVDNPTTETLDNVVEAPTVHAWLVGAVTRTSGPSHHGTVSLRKITDDEINGIYETFITDPVSETGNLQVALHVFAQTRFGKCDNLLRHGETDRTPDDIISGFVIDLIERFGKGEYHTHARKFHHWINKKWAFYYSEQAIRYTRERKMTIAVNETDFDDEAAEQQNRVAGELYRIDVEREAMQRRDKGWNTPAEQVRRMLQELDEPATFWGKLSEPAKKMIRSMAKGQTQAQAANSAGITDKEGFRVVRNLREKATSNPEIKNGLSRFGATNPQSNSEDECEVICIQASADCKITTITKLMNTAEASQMLGIRPATLRGWKAQHIGPPFVQHSARCVRYAESDILTYVNERRTVPSVRETRETL